MTWNTANISKQDLQGIWLSPSMVSKRISSNIPLSFFSLEEMSSKAWAWASFSPPQKIHHKTL